MLSHSLSPSMCQWSSAKKLQWRLVNTYDRSFTGLLPSNRSKVLVFERNKNEVVNFNCSYRVKVECPKECNIKLNGEKMEEVNEFKYLGSNLCKHGSMEGETRERSVQGRRVIGSLESMIKIRTVDMS